MCLVASGILTKVNILPKRVQALWQNRADTDPAVEHHGSLRVRLLQPWLCRPSRVATEPLHPSKETNTHPTAHRASPSQQGPKPQSAEVLMAESRKRAVRKNRVPSHQRDVHGERPGNMGRAQTAQS